MERSSKLGECIKKRREELGLSVKEVAEKANISDTEMYRIEKGIRTNPSLKTFGDLARALHLTFESLAVMAGYIDSNSTNLVQSLNESYDEFMLKIKRSSYFYNTLLELNNDYAENVLDNTAFYLNFLISPLLKENSTGGLSNYNSTEARVKEIIVSDLALAGYRIIPIDEYPAGHFVAADDKQSVIYHLICFSKDGVIDNFDTILKHYIIHIYGQLANDSYGIDDIIFVTNNDHVYKHMKSYLLENLSLNVSVALLDDQHRNWQQTLRKIK